MHDNSGYGFDPHDDSDFLTIHDSEVYNNGYHGIIASKRCNGVSIQVQCVNVAASGAAYYEYSRSKPEHSCRVVFSWKEFVFPAFKRCI